MLTLLSDLHFLVLMTSNDYFTNGEQREMLGIVRQLLSRLHGIVSQQDIRQVYELVHAAVTGGFLWYQPALASGTHRADAMPEHCC